MNNSMIIQVLFLVGFIALIYFLMIKPQKKKEKEITEMRNSLTVGDEIITIGGIYGKVVKTKEDSLIIQVGADKVKFEITRWAVSSIVKKGKKASSTETKEEKPSGPRRLKRSSSKEEKPEDTKIKEISSEEVE